MRFLYHDSLGSTQDEARSLYRAGERGPLWVQAGQQTNGRGRRARRWVSEMGNLYATCIYPSRCAPAQSALYGFAAALAVADTLAAYNPVNPVTLKWPNDVLIGGAKISGLLIEREAEGLLVGIGINLVSHPDDTPYAATHLVAQLPPDALDTPEPTFTGARATLALLANHVSQRFATLEREGFSPIRAAWMARAHYLGRQVTVNGQTGTFSDLAPDGALCLALADGTETRVHAGDVSFG